jgi:D-arabinose 1-dehydrogenase-like Zn-dependent alcohol dehydrogenase
MQMHAMVLEQFGGRLTATVRTVPEPEPGEVLVRVVACGAGLTLESVRLGHLGGSTPRIMGHELFPLSQAEDALEAIRLNQVFGRVLIDCAG